MAQAAARQGERANELIRQGNGSGQPANGDQAALIASLQAQITDNQSIIARQATEFSRMKGAHRTQIQGFEQTIAGLRGELEQARRAPPANNGLPPGVTEEDRATYGDGLVKLIDKVATERAGEKVPPAPPAPPVEEEREDPYMDVLRSHIHNFDVRNNDPQFVVWLGAVDPVTKNTRNQLLQSAFASRATRDIAEVFNAYAERREVGAGTTTTISPSPSGSGGGSPSPNEESEFITPAFIAEHYKKSKLGKYAGKEGQKEYQQNEAKIAAAMRDGKIRAPAVG